MLVSIFIKLLFPDILIFPATAISGISSGLYCDSCAKP